MTVLTLTPREQRITTLLEWYQDVLHGDALGGASAGELGLKLMSRAWNSRSYQELHRCLLALRDEENRTYWHVRETFLTGGRRTVLACPRCSSVVEIAAKHFSERGDVKLQHKHGDVVFFVRKTVPVVNAAVDPELVSVGVRWLAERFEGEPFVPDELLAKERAA